MRTIIVNDQDEVIGLKDNDKLIADDIYRSSALLITNSLGQMLMAQRAFTKKHEPGHWGPSVAGTVDEGEDYLSNIIKEAREEIGLIVEPERLIVGPKLKTIRKDGYAFFCQLYHYIIDKPIEDFIIQKEEVEQIKWCTKQEVIESINYQDDIFLINIREWMLSLL